MLSLLGEEGSLGLLPISISLNTAAIFRRDSEGRDMPDAILFDDSDGEGAHLVIFRPGFWARNGVGFESSNERSRARKPPVDKTAHIQLPQLVFKSDSNNWRSEPLKTWDL